jgi:hypothetical protein
MKKAKLHGIPYLGTNFKHEDPFVFYTFVYYPCCCPDNGL